MSKKRASTLKPRTAPARPAAPGEDKLPVPPKTGILFPAIIAAAGILSYLNSLHAPFIFDDRYHIVENAHIRHLWPLSDVLLSSSRPVIQLSLALNYAFGGLNPWGYHIFNIAIHIATALVLFGLARRTFLSEPLRRRWALVAAPASAFIALIWLVHPIQTESVTYIVQRGESMMGLFYLLTVYCVARTQDTQRNLLWSAGAVISCLLGMGCKGVIVTAPLTALLYDRAFLAKSWAEVWQRRKVLYGALGLTWLAYPAIVTLGMEWKESAGFDYAGASPSTYALTQPSVILHYLRLALWPAGFSLDYGWPPAHGLAEAGAPVAIVLGLLALCVWAWRRNPALAFLGAWFFLILAPTSSFIPIADMAVDHRMYLSLAALAALAVVGIVIASRHAGEEPLRVGKSAWAVCGVLICVLAVLTVRRNSDYSSDLTIWRETVRVSPGNPRAQYDLGASLEHAGEYPDAISHYQTAVQLKPDYVDALNNLGHAMELAGQAAESTSYLRRAIALKPNLAEAHCNLGYALAQRGTSGTQRRSSKRRYGSSRITPMQITIWESCSRWKATPKRPLLIGKRLCGSIRSWPTRTTTSVMPSGNPDTLARRCLTSMKRCA